MQIKASATFFIRRNSMNTMTMMKFAEAVRVEVEKKIDKKAVIQRINKYQVNNPH